MIIPECCFTVEPIASICPTCKEERTVIVNASPEGIEVLGLCDNCPIHHVYAHYFKKDSNDQDSR